MQRPVFKWLVFAACLAMFLGAMGWVSWRTLAMERQRELAESDAQVQERLRLALWRMDAIAGPLIMRESARPPSHYQAFYAPEDLFTTANTPIQKGKALVPSPLLGVLPEFVLLNFEITSGSPFMCASPQVPTGKDQQLTTNWYSASPQAASASARLTKLNALLGAHPEITTLPAAAGESQRRETAKPGGERAPDREVVLKPAEAPASAAPVLEMTKDAPSSVSAPVPAAPVPLVTAATSRQRALNSQELSQRNALVQSQVGTNESGKLLLRKKEMAAPASPPTTPALEAKSAGALATRTAEGSAASQQLDDVLKKYRAQAPPPPAPASAAAPSASAPAQSAGRGDLAASEGYLKSDKPAAKPADALAPSKAKPTLEESRAAIAAMEAQLERESPDAALLLNPPADAPGGFVSVLKQSAAAGTADLESSAKSFDARWVEGELFLLREAALDGARRTQGVWLDWAELEKRLLQAITDLLPAARLQEASAALRGLDSSALASLPVRLLPGALDLPAAAFWSPLKRSLLIAWGCFLIAALAVALVLHRAIMLSERRGAFVSAVTHELRTPLTTFRLYSEMLADDMVPDAGARQQYLRTLCDESTRLTHLVENVLAYSRIERGRAVARVEEVTLAGLMSRIEPRLRRRAAEAGLELEVAMPEHAPEARFKTDPMGVEQILFNLVDNACKYAAPTSDPRVLHVSADAAGPEVTFRVRDHGPGISRQQRKRLFQPFEKSAADAAHSAPGVGLGLALCRRLAREMGGDLVLEKVEGGACFALNLPPS